MEMAWSTVLADLVRCAEQMPGLSSLQGMLEVLARSSKSLGCIVWEALPPKPDVESLEGSMLFSLAQWFSEKEPWRKIDVPVRGSLTGLAVLTKKLQFSNDILTDPRAFRSDEWLVDVGPVCTVPITLHDQLSDVAHNAITFYRLKGERPYSLSERNTLDGILVLLPVLAQAVRNRVSFDLLHGVDEILERHQAEEVQPERCEEKIREILQEVRDRLSGSFRCREMSIYLRDREEDSIFHDIGSTVSTDKRGTSDEYQVLRDSDTSVTSWVTRSRTGLLLVDLNRWERDYELLRTTHPELSREHLAQELHSRRKAVEDKDRVLSFIAAPLIGTKQVEGLLCCCEVIEEPKYFSMRDLKLLELVASRLGPYIEHLRIYHGLRNETDSWRDLVKTVEGLNQFVTDEFKGTPPGSKEFTERAAMDIRKLLASVDTAEVHWEESAADAPPATRALLAVLDNSKCVKVRDEDLEKLKWYVGEGAVSRKTRHLLLAEVACGRRFGVLSLGSLKSPFTQHSEYVAQILGHLLGLYRFLGSKMDESADSRRIQTQAFADLRHQIRSPILSAYRYVIKILPSHPADERLQRTLNAVRGLTSKSLSVANCVGLYADLAAGDPPKLETRRVSVSQLRQKLIEAAMDHQLIFLDSKGVRFDVLKNTFDVIENINVQVDLNLYLQCVNNLLENAGKYSHRGRPVQISCSATSKRFQLSVRNIGIKLTKEDAVCCVGRNWRSEYVRDFIRDTGHGIGLWIVNEVMKSHYGSLEPVPTNNEGWTEFRMFVPVEK